MFHTFADVWLTKALFLIENRFTLVVITSDVAVRMLNNRVFKHN